MKATLLVLTLLAGCTSLPERGHFSFECVDGLLVAAAVFEGYEDQPKAAPVGRCVGELMIVGQHKGTGT